MAAKLVLYQIRDFVRITERGEIDLAGSKQLVREIAQAATAYTDHNILLDMREANIELHKMSDVLEVAMYMFEQDALSGFVHKIANVVKNDEKILMSAKKIKSCLDIEGFHYEYFTSFEDAIEWLAETAPHT